MQIMNTRRAGLRISLAGVALALGCTRVLAINRYGLFGGEIVAQDGDLEVGSAVAFYATSFTELIRQQVLPLTVLYLGVQPDPYTQGYLDNLQANAALGQQVIDAAQASTSLLGAFDALQAQIDAVFLTGGNSTDPDYQQGWDDAHQLTNEVLSSVMAQVSIVSEVLLRTVPQLWAPAPSCSRAGGTLRQPLR
jgi:hypothetical protein